MNINTADEDDHEEIISYHKLRTFIGIIGIFLPIAVVTGCYILGAKGYSFQHSISHYYYSKMHIVFVCTLCVLGGFLITYKGKSDNPWESRVSNLAGYCAFGIAAFPTSFNGFRADQNGTNQYLELVKKVTESWGSVHFAFAGSLFGCFIIFCLYFFQKPDRIYTSSNDKLKWNRRKLLYKICGWGIAVSIIMIALFNFVIHYDKGLFAYTTFIFETTSLMFFGTAWLVKGSLVWKSVPVLRTLIKPLR